MAAWLETPHHIQLALALLAGWEVGLESRQGPEAAMDCLQWLPYLCVCHPCKADVTLCTAYYACCDLCYLVTTSVLPLLGCCRLNVIAW